MKLIENELFLKFTKLENYPNLLHFYTKRPFSLVFPLDKTKEKSLKELTSNLNYDIKKYILARQEHTNKVIKITKDNLNEEILGIDGLITNLKNVALLTTTADCQAILLYDPSKQVIGNIHSGWKGTLSKIIVNAINIMVNDYGCNPQDIIACICPSILKCCFEVDEDVVNDFQNNFNNIDEFITKGQIIDHKQKYYIDTVGLNQKLLLELGLSKDNIITSDICTKCHYDTYHSYRARSLAKVDGRNIACILLKE